MTKPKFEEFLEGLLEQNDLFDEPTQSQELAVETDAHDASSAVGLRNPFKFLDAYTAEDADIFFGRQVEIAELYRQVFSNKVTVIFGNSGTGKTSLVQCGFAAKLKPEQATLFRLRAAIDPLLSLKTDCIEKVCTYQEGASLFENLCQMCKSLRKTVILFFDQFEEIFILQSTEKRKQFLKLLLSILSADLDLKIIISIREEYFPRLIEFERVVPEILMNRVWIRNMSGIQAEMVIENPCKICGVELEPGVSKLVIHELAQGKDGVELPYVQVVMDNLFHRAIRRNPDQPVIQLHDLMDQGGVKNILSNFIEDQIKDMPEPEKSRQVLKTLVTSEGTKRMVELVTIQDLADNYGQEIPEKDLELILHQLVQRRILREDPETNMYELSHDSLAAIIFQWMTGLEQELMEVRQILENRYKEYLARGVLLDIDTIKYVTPYESRIRLKAEQQLFLEESKKSLSRKKKRYIISAFLILFIFLITVSMLAIYSYFKAIESDKQKDQAFQQKQLALDALQKAEIERKRTKGGRLVEMASTALREKNYNTAEILLAKSLSYDDQKSTREKLIHARSLGLRKDWIQVRDSHQGLSVFNHAGTYMAAQNAQILEIWSVEKKEKLFDISLVDSKASDIKVESIAFGDYPNNQQYIAFSKNDLTIQVWQRLSDGSLARLAAFSGFKKRVSMVAFHPTLPLLAASSEDMSIRLYNLSNDPSTALIWEVQNAHGTGVHTVKFNSDGTLLASAGSDYKIRVWDVESILRPDPLKNNQEARYTLEGHKDSVLSIAFHPKNKYIASSGYDRVIRIWDIHTPSRPCIRLLTGHKGTVLELVFSADGMFLATGAKDETVRLWDYMNNNVIMTIPSHNGVVRSISFVSIANGIKFGGEKGWSSWKIGNRDEATLIWNDGHAVSSLSFHPKDHSVAVGGSDGFIRRWTLTGEKLSPMLQVREQEKSDGPTINSVLFSPSGRWMAAGGDGQTLTIWDTQNWKPQVEIPHAGPIWGLVFDPHEKWIATSNASNQHAIHIWDIPSWKLQTSIATQASVFSLTVNSDGRYLASGDAMGHTRLYKINPLQQVNLTENVISGERRVWSLSFDLSDQFIVSGNSDGNIRKWNPFQKMQEQHTVTSSPNVNSISIQTKSGSIASGGDGGSVQIFNQELKLVMEFFDVDGTIWMVSFSRDGRLLAFGGLDGFVRIKDMGQIENTLFNKDAKRILQESEEATGLVVDGIQVKLQIKN